MKTRITKALAATALLGATLVGGGGATATASGAVNGFEAICNVSGGEVVFEGTVDFNHLTELELSEDRPGCVIDKDESLSGVSASKFWGVCNGMGYDSYTSPWYEAPYSYAYTCIARSEVKLG